MKMTFLRNFSLIALITLLFSACTSDDREIPVITPPPSGDYSNGLFILNEGGFGYSNASVSFLDNSGEVYNSIFSGVNGVGLGDTAQSMAFHDEYAYIILTTSSTVEVVNRYTFEYVATVSTQIVNPRYITFSGAKGYVTNWGDPNDVTDDYVAVLDLETNLVESIISVPEGPEKLLLNNGSLYVAHKGGYGYGATISVLDVASQTVTNSIPVGDVPDGMVINNDDLYVICSGKPSFTGDETVASLHKINLSDTVVTNLYFAPQQHPNFLQFDNDALFYTMDAAVYTINLNNFQLPTNAAFSTAADDVDILYGFAVHNGKIYIADAKDYVSNGEALIYTLNGELQERFPVQIIPNSFYFDNL